MGIADLYSRARDIVNNDRKAPYPNLGDKVRDTITGFEGVVVARHLYLHGCERQSVQPLVNKDGKVPDPVTFDAPQLRLVAKEAAPVGDPNIGGPEKYMPGARPTG